MRIRAVRARRRGPVRARGTGWRSSVWSAMRGTVMMWLFKVFVLLHRFRL